MKAPTIRVATVTFFIILISLQERPEPPYTPKAEGSKTIDTDKALSINQARTILMA
ncbi:hypothetical protein KDH_33350 [Dictyobacter sp. S3.2.2.5]|uniref:Uncharacterized protein n=1 Tax=Dictyobacter halimunensis TaxID=3026934 RepID=A0ABQ6FQF6_9CHLR|nr:hypothetical protein KDH_33350 [Dictyobacter sp. S3.2.2.5]